MHFFRNKLLQQKITVGCNKYTSFNLLYTIFMTTLSSMWLDNYHGNIFQNFLENLEEMFLPYYYIHSNVFNYAVLTIFLRVTQYYVTENKGHYACITEETFFYHFWSNASVFFRESWRNVSLLPILIMCTQILLNFICFRYLCLRNRATALSAFNCYTSHHPQIKQGPPFVRPLLNFLWFLLLATERWVPHIQYKWLNVIIYNNVQIQKPEWPITRTHMLLNKLIYISILNLKDITVYVVPKKQILKHCLNQSDIFVTFLVAIGCFASEFLENLVSSPMWYTSNLLQPFIYHHGKKTCLFLVKQFTVKIK